MRIEWCVAVDEAQTDEKGEIKALGRPVDTTWTDELPDEAFPLAVLLCFVADDEDGANSPQFQYEVRDPDDQVVGQTAFVVPTMIFRAGSHWPPEVPLRFWAVLHVQFRAEAYGYYEIRVGLDDQAPVIIGHVVELIDA